MFVGCLVYTLFRWFVWRLGLLGICVCVVWCVMFIAGY